MTSALGFKVILGLLAWMFCHLHATDSSDLPLAKNKNDKFKTVLTFPSIDYKVAF